MADRPERNLDFFASKLDDGSVDAKSKCALATELRDGLETWCQANTYAQFLAKLTPIFLKILDGQPVFISTSPEQRLRNTVLEILHRLPQSPAEIIQPYAAQIVDKLMALVKTENEDNAALCMKTIMDFQRHQTTVLAEKVQPFLDLIQEMFQMMEQAVQETLDNTHAGVPNGVPSTPSHVQYSQSPRPGSPVASAPEIGNEQLTTRQLIKGMSSFKVLAECPIIVVSLFQTYRQCVPRNVKQFIPLIKSVLMLQAKPQEKAHEEAKAQGRPFTGVSKEIKNRAAFGEFITAQVKTMSFLAYLLRVYAQHLSDFLPTLPDIIVRLLKDCPKEKSAARKELLVAIRHIINFNFRKIFLVRLDDLLDERTLIGDGLTVYESLRPLAYSMLADLIHHVRESLSKEQIRRTIEVYTKNLHDDYPGTSFQTMSAKLLLNMAECIAKLDNKEDGRHFLIMILNAIGDKFAAMNRQYQNAIKMQAQYAYQSIEATPEDFMAEKNEPDWDGIDIFSATPIKTWNPRDRESDPVSNNRFLFKNLLHGLKSLFYQLRICNPPSSIEAANAPANWHEVSYGYNAEEVEVFIKLLREGAHVFRYYSLEPSPTEFNATSPVELLANHHMVSSGKEEKDLLESFGTVFHHVDPATFHEIFYSEIPHLYDMMFEHPALLHIPQFLLASEATSPAFAGMLLQFLMARLEDVGTSDVRKASILLRLFKLAFMAVTLFSQQNEQVLLPHVTKLVTKSIQLSTTAEEPMNYFILLRSLFRSIGGGRFEHLYKEILPLLEMLLEVLNNLLLSARRPQDRDLFVELSLTVPARLSNLLPHLSFLMRPLVVALRAGSDLVGQGLRTLELCVDNLTADYLDPIMAPVIEELMAALWEHLKPTPYSHFHAHTTMRILGKLGGRNRKFISGPPPVQYKDYADDECSVDIKMIGSTRERAMPLRLGIDVAIARLKEISKPNRAKQSDLIYKKNAFKLIASDLKLFIGTDHLPDDFAQLMRLQATDLVEGRLDTGSDLLAISDRSKSTAKRDSEHETLRKLLNAVFFASTLPELKDEASALLTNVCRHFIILEVGKALSLAKHMQKPFDVMSGEGPVVLESTVLADAFLDSLSSEKIEVREVAEQAILATREVVTTIFGSAEKIDRLQFYAHLLRTFCHACYEEEWFTKAGGALGLDIIVSKLNLSDEFLAPRQRELVVALLYVMKDMPPELPSDVRTKAQRTIEKILQRCHKNSTKEDMNDRTSKLYMVCATLIGELNHLNKHVRSAVQKIFDVLAEVVGAEVYELVAPVKERIIHPIEIKPIRALPFPNQIGHIEAMTFLLKLRHGIVDFKNNKSTDRLLMESLALADSDDEHLTQKPLEQRNADMIIKFRVACIRLLSTAMDIQEFQESQSYNNSRARIIAVFFKSLYSKATEVVEAAEIGLRGVLAATSKLPKDLLQNGLRPILMNLQDPRKLSVDGLEGLARLLTLLTNYFKVEIGARLLDHTKTIADAATLQKISFTLIEQNRAMKVITAILNVFHLLPQQALSFMDQLIQKVLDLERDLRRSHDSPFRKPLIQYLNRYSKESWAYFKERMKDHTQGRFFAQLLSNPLSRPLREAVINDVSGFQSTFESEADDNERWIAAVNAIHIIKSICSFPESSNWLVANPDLRKKLFATGVSLELKRKANTLDVHLRLSAEQAGDQLMEIITIYLSNDLQNFDFLFEVIDALTAGRLKEFPSFISFIYEKLVCSDATNYQRSLVMRGIEQYNSRNATQKTKTYTLHYIVSPIFAMDIKRNWNSLFGSTKGTKLFDKPLVDTIHNRLWKPASTETILEDGRSGVDHSRLELLQLTTLLIKYHPNMANEARKDIIKFGWNFIKLEDIINKQAAYVLTAYFIAQYPSPAKITMQVYQALLKAHQNEGRALVAQGLEVLAPVLQKRLGQDAKVPVWAKVAKKILAEESSNLQQLTSIFQFMVRHENLFYEARESLAPTIMQSLTKIAQPPNPSNDQKKLALNLITLIWKWEERAAREASSSAPSTPNSTKRKADGTEIPNGHTAVPPRRNFVAIPQLRLMLIKYLVQFIASVPERYPVPSAEKKEVNHYSGIHQAQGVDMCKKSLRLLHDLLSPSYWSDLDIDAMFPRVTEQILTSDPKNEEKPEGWFTKQVNTLQILKVLVNVKNDEWVVARLEQLQKLLEKPLRSENSEIQDCLHTPDVDDDENKPKLVPLVQRIVDAVPDDKEAEEEEGAMDEDKEKPGIINHLSNIVSEMMSANNYVSAINILWTLSKRKPEELDQHIPSVMKALQTKIAKDHVATQTPQMPPGMAGPRPSIPPETPLDPREQEIITDLILKIIDLVAVRMPHLGDSRRPYLSVLASLVEKSQSIAVCSKILDMVTDWVFNSSDPVPTLKEKTAVLHKMLIFEHRDEALLNKFLDLVIRIYEDPKVTRSELTVRMEMAFLIGTRAQNVDMRNRFMSIFDRSISRTASNRIKYVLASQNWDTLGESFWLSQVIQLLFGAVEMHNHVSLDDEDFRVLPASMMYGTYKGDERVNNIIVDNKLEALVASHKIFVASLGEVRAQDILEPLGQIQHTDRNLAHDIWVAIFPLCWSVLSKEDRIELEKGMVVLMTKDYHQRQLAERPNCIGTMLEGIARTKPRPKFPPHVIKYLARMYDAWYVAACSLEDNAIDPTIDTATLRESNLDALLEIYASLEEDDLFYGTWRRRCQYVETNAALSYEQNGMWDKAQQMYETAQIKARTGTLPFAQGEYMLWEDHWVLCAQKLQQWEILGDFAKHENFNDLYLESTWRTFEAWTNSEHRDQLDSIVKSVSDAPTMRRMFFHAFLALLKMHNKQESTQELNRLIDENIQLSIRKWHQLPKRITNAHIPILQNFQQLVELHDAALISNSLQNTNATNLDMKSQELKLLLGTWRDRLPNFWDDINAWQSLVTWRQHVFQLINATYLSLVPNSGGNTQGSSFAYRGYHETAWIINRFAHVARKHQMPEVCINQLSRIYTLPNIEIQEAFLKLREQAKCHYQNKSELSSGLDVINNTNLSYFGAQQKAEFYTLKGMFQDKLGEKEAANDAFGSALYFDIKLPKAWAEWGRYNDMLFRAEPTAMEKGGNAISCYLEAAGQYKSAKSRKLISRVLWLLSLDDDQEVLAKAFDAYKGETPVWYWITFIPQLLIGLSRKEAPFLKGVLVKLAKNYPQALYFQLRTTKEDLYHIRRSEEATKAKEKVKNQAQAQQSGEAVKQGSPSASRPGTANGDRSSSRPGTSNGDAGQTQSQGSDGANASGTTQATPKVEQGEGTNGTNSQSRLDAEKNKKPWDHAEELMTVLKTAFPLLSLSMEQLVDQIQAKFKCPPDEDAYRLIVALLNDGLQWIGRTPPMYAKSQKLPAPTEANITRFSESVLPSHIRKFFEEDFVRVKPTAYEYIHKLRKWRDRFEEKLDRRNPRANLEHYSLLLSEFRFGKFDDIEVPGQYLEHRDKNQDFVRIERLMPAVDQVRGVGVCHRRLKIRGHDGSVHPFAVQHPASRSSRREERMLQMFRTFNTTMSKKKESRRRNLKFHLPEMVPLSPQVRMIRDDPTYISLQGVFEDYCRRNNVSKDEPILYTIEKLQKLTSPPPNTNPQSQNAANVNLSVKMDTFLAVQEKFVPNSILKDYMQAIYPSFADYYLFRRQFAYQLAALTFMTYIIPMAQRYPHKMVISRGSGNIWGMDLLPNIHNNHPVIVNQEAVPFRLTPNLQVFLGPLATEGIFACTLQTIARCLAEPLTSSDIDTTAQPNPSGGNAPPSSTSNGTGATGIDLDMQLSIFMRDEVHFWFTQYNRSAPDAKQLRAHVATNSGNAVKKALSLARTPDSGNLPCNQTAIDEVAKSVAPKNLAQTDPLWMAYL